MAAATFNETSSKIDADLVLLERHCQSVKEETARQVSMHDVVTMCV